MSKKAKIILATLAFVLLVAVIGFAQRPFGNNQSNPNSFQGGHQLFHQLNPEQVAELKAKKMQLVLDLNEEEYEKAYSIALKFAEKMKGNIKELKTEPGRPSSGTFYKIQLKKMELLKDVKEQLKSFLTAEEIDKWMLIMMKH